MAVKGKDMVKLPVKSTYAVKVDLAFGPTPTGNRVIYTRREIPPLDDREVYRFAEQNKSSRTGRQTEGASRSILPAYHGVTAKLQHFLVRGIPGDAIRFAGTWLK